MRSGEVFCRAASTGRSWDESIACRSIRASVGEAVIGGGSASGSSLLALRPHEGGGMECVCVCVPMYVPCANDELEGSTSQPWMRSPSSHGCLSCQMTGPEFTVTNIEGSRACQTTCQMQRAGTTDSGPCFVCGAGPRCRRGVCGARAPML